jgi:transglutaminase-like putative cysteine protease
MQLAVRHRTTYRYASRARFLAQVLRMTPLDGPGQRVLHWRVEVERGRCLPSYLDGFGNLTHLHTLHRWHEELSIHVQGLVETRETCGVLGALREALPPAFFLCATPLTAPHELLEALAARCARAASGLARLQRLMELVRESVAYVPGATDAQTSAAQALLRGAGVCQDHAHVFVAAARQLGHPARYVSGYLHAGADADAALASHAWAEAWLPELGWVGFDASSGSPPTERYVRTGVGRDYADAAPLRGVRRGAPGHSLHVRVHVEEVSLQ